MKINKYLLLIGFCFGFISIRNNFKLFEIYFSIQFYLFFFNFIHDFKSNVSSFNTRVLSLLELMIEKFHEIQHSTLQVK